MGDRARGTGFGGQPSAAASEGRLIGGDRPMSSAEASGLRNVKRRKTAAMRTEPSAHPDELTYALIHGGGDVGWVWHLVEAELRRRGRRTVAIDLPLEDDSAGPVEYAHAVIAAVGAARQVVVVGHSFGGFTAPIVAEELSTAILLVLVAGMVPRPGEAPDRWWVDSGYTAAVRDPDPGDVIATFYQDVEPALAEEAVSRGRDSSGRRFSEPWPLASWPDVPTRYLLFRQDRLFPPAFVRTMVRERLGVQPDEMDGSHCAMLSRPAELAAYLEAAASDLTGG